MIEMMVVGVVVTVALAWAGRAIWRSVRGGKGCSSCADSGNCPLQENPQLLEELTSLGPKTCHPGQTNCKDLLDTLQTRGPR